MSLGLFRLLKARHYVIAAQDRLRQAPASTEDWVGERGQESDGSPRSASLGRAEWSAHTSSSPTMGFA